MTLPPRRAAAAAALVLAGTLTGTGCGSGASSSQAPTTTSSSTPGSTAPSSGAAPAPGTGASSPGSASSGAGTGATSSAPTGDRHQVERRKGGHRKARHEKAEHRKDEHRAKDERRQRVRERKRLIHACVRDTETLNEAVSTYNAAVSSGDQDDLDYAAAILREAAGTVDHQAARAGNHRLNRLSNRVVGDLGTIASHLEQGEDVPSSSGQRLTRHSTKLHSFCSDKV